MKKFRTRRVVFAAIAVAMVAALGSSALFLHAGAAHASPAANGQNVQNITETGTGGFANGAAGLSGDTRSQAVPTDDDRDQHTNAKYDQAPTTNPNPSGSPVTTHNQGFTGYQGLNHYDTRTRDNGNAYSLEPPDQGLCTNGSKVLESVNDVLVVFDTHGNRLTTPTSMNTFFGLPYAIDRTSGVAGPFLSDPKCYYDAGTNRWFLSMLEEDATGVRSHTLLAVSQTSNPAGLWTDFSIDATDDGLNGTPSNPDCPCFGDQPLLGADAYGLYISTNEFPDFVAGFNGAQIYAMSKWQLASAASHGSSTLPAVVHINAGAIPTPDAGGIWYSIQPATSPGTSLLDLGHHGTEYFLSSLQFGPAPLDNRIAAWALTNTRSLSSAHPSVTLLDTVIHSETYGGTQFAASQKAGNIPLGDTLGDTANLLNTNDDRMNQVVYASGLLYSGVNTAVNADGSRTGIAYFIVFPFVYDNHSGTHIGAIMAKQGYVAAADNNTFFPSIGVNRYGQGVMTFTLSGPNYYPTSAYVTVDVVHGAGKIHVAGAGVGPADGFTGYPQYGGNGVERWGDYSAAVAAPDGSIWFASEYIAQTCTDAQYAADTTCGNTRTSLANWSTFIGHVTNLDDR